MHEILDEVTRASILEKILPTPEELDTQRETIVRLTAAVTAMGKAKGYNFRFVDAQGSTGKKQTQLRGAADIDLFIGLDPDEYREYIDLPHADRHRAIDAVMNDLVDNWFTPAVSAGGYTDIRKTYSQHPYLSLKYGNLEIDILACFDLDPETLERDGPITAVDRTKHHSDFIAEQLTERSRENARLLKSFARAAHAYGDRCAVGQMGFTGVALEYIAILSEDLDDAIEKIFGLDMFPIDHKNRTQDQLKSIPPFKDDFIFIIDPTDSSRNMAASYSQRAYRWIKLRIIELSTIIAEGWRKDVPSYFLEAPIPHEDISGQLRDHVVSSEYVSNDSVHYTILRDKLHRVMRKVETALVAERTGEARFGEVLSELYFEKNRYAIGFLVEHSTISEEYVRRGPSTELESACEEFRKAHPEARESDGYLWGVERREWTNAKELITSLLKDSEIEGLSYADSSIVSKRVENVLVRFILNLEFDLKARLMGLTI